MAKHILTANDGSKGGKMSKRKPFDTKIKHMLEDIRVNGKDGNDELVDMLIYIAKNSVNYNERTIAIKELWDRAYGKAKQHIKHEEDKPENPISKQLRLMREQHEKEKNGG